MRNEVLIEKDKKVREAGLYVRFADYLVLTVVELTGYDDVGLR